MPNKVCLKFMFCIIKAYFLMTVIGWSLGCRTILNVVVVFSVVVKDSLDKIPVLLYVFWNFA